MPVLVDTTVWIDFFHNRDCWQVERFEQLVKSGEVLVGDLILCEILQGFRLKRDFDHVRDHLLAFPIYSLVGTSRAVRSAENYLRLRSLGYTVRKTVDVWIATFCIDADLPLLHNDRDFEICQRELGLKCLGE